MQIWYVYILRCSDHSLYTGITTDINRRLDEHNNDDRRASAYTRARRPVKLVFCEKYGSRSLATKREREIKTMTRREKEMIARQN